MHDDDRPVGRTLSRRELVGLFGASFAAAATMEAAPPATALDAQDCIALPQQTEGPYFVEERLNRADIRLDPATGQMSAGAPMDLRLVISTVASAGTCQALAGAQVDIWHCDAMGVYSDVRDRSADTTGKKFLRGHQVTDNAGQVRFTTIYPGWYGGRAVHVHFKVRRPAGGGRIDEFTSQLYFDDALTDRVYQRPPYAGREDRERRNENDGIYRDGGDQLMLAVTEHEGGYAATFEIGLDLS